MTHLNRFKMPLFLAALATVAIFGIAQGSGKGPKSETKSAKSTSKPTAKMEKITKTDAQWRAQLSPQAYEVLRNHGTESPNTSPLLKIHETGEFICAGCGQELFASNTKFDSGTGWPSFYQPIKPSAVIEKTDSTYGMQRTEVLCARCGGHLGHVFDDGPKPTGLRYCMNGVALKFEKDAKK